MCFLSYETMQGISPNRRSFREINFENLWKSSGLRGNSLRSTRPRREFFVHAGNYLRPFRPEQGNSQIITDCFRNTQRARQPDPGVLFKFPFQSRSLKDALSACWRVSARCLGGRVEYTRSTAKCPYEAGLSLETLVGRAVPTCRWAALGDRMMCPRCGNRRVNLIFEPPPVAGRW